WCCSPIRVSHAGRELKPRVAPWCTPDCDRHLRAPVAEGPHGPRPLRGLRVSHVLLIRVPPFPPARRRLPLCAAVAAACLRDRSSGRCTCLSSPLTPPPPRPRRPTTRRPRRRNSWTSYGASPLTPSSSPPCRAIPRAAPGCGSTGRVAARHG